MAIVLLASVNLDLAPPRKRGQWKGTEAKGSFIRFLTSDAIQRTQRERFLTFR